jgi:transcriptional regulator with XRE-family HTH domain
MSESFPSGRIPMVKIDGAKIRQLRESQGLTQLFLATSVEVTTDTISRWENKRYPTIKRENGIKLAEALDVGLDDILDHSDTQAVVEEPEGDTQEQADTQTATPPAQFFGKKSLIITAGCVLLVFFLWWFVQTPQDMAVSARRILPSHTVAGQPFPVAISVSTGSSMTHTLILKESLPPEAVLISAVPKNSSVGHEMSLKWLRKIKEKKMFAYVVKIESSSAVSAVFAGTVAVHKAPGEQIKVSGSDRISIGEYHWADNNGDGIISDEEILTVYDEFSEISGLEFDIDQVEEIWLGSGYEWNTASGSFIVLP